MFASHVVRVVARNNRVHHRVNQKDGSQFCHAMYVLTKQGRWVEYRYCVETARRMCEFSMDKKAPQLRAYSAEREGTQIDMQQDKRWKTCRVEEVAESSQVAQPTFIVDFMADVSQLKDKETVCFFVGRIRYQK